ncbi:DUF1244 domain-containing protein [Psychromonas sp. Urea-02u-13]|uniref:DUF1244 domain-containing protein n=1 Tax=Psychromonas sp. Urea-02u-13 TaxID=2058326 RepID=UPI000C328A01|nr:DUF1244 domain-containing protein [Psychromonas sp. Urea-02u-13]PKG38370.1 DUF1244 domain-containing protein [Psychromonas sp. Urea-02u-13]
MSPEQQTQIEAAAFRRLLTHLDSRKDVQNIELMNLAGFCRNCLSKWMMAEAGALNVDLDSDQARELVYSMPYEQWKVNHQLPATAEQLAAFEAIQAAK